MDSNQEIMRTMPPNKLFFRYLIPSLLGMALMASNILIDGLFVSHGVGEQALAGVNIAAPIYSVILAISLWIGMGGGTLYSIAHGQNNKHRGKEIFSISILVTVVITGIIIFLGLIFKNPLAYAFGATAEVFPYVDGYLQIILLFGLVFVFENILSIFVRNDGNPNLAMIGLIITSLTNIVLNYIFIFEFNWGVKGAAFASALGGVIGTVVLLTHFLTKNNQLSFVKILPDFAIIKEILIIGFPSFVIEVAALITVVSSNLAFGYFVGETGLVAYAVVNFVNVVFLMLFIGLASSVQPIISYHYGAKLFERMKDIIRIALKTGIVMGLVVFIVGIFGKGGITEAFNIRVPEVVAFTKTGIVYFFSGYLFLGINLIFIIYYQSVGEIRLATWITLLQGVLLYVPFLVILPLLFNNEAIWLAFPIAQGGTSLLIYLAITYKWIEFMPRTRKQIK